MTYLIILISLIVGFQFMNINVRFPFNYDIYINYLFEKIEGLKPQYMYLKEKMVPVIIKLGYNLVYVFSVCQIQMNKMINMLVPYVKNVKKYLKDNNIIVEVKTQTLNLIDKNGIIKTRFLISNKSYNLGELCEGIFDDKNVSGIVLHDIDDKTECINKIYMEKCPELKEGKLDYKLSTISFIMVELEHNNEKHKIELKNDEHNYYIVNNSLNQNFFKYYLKNILQASINDDIFDYTVTIIDHNVNFITLLPEQYIIFNENDYTIFPILETNKPTNCVDISDTITTNNNDEQVSIDSDKSDDFVKLESDN